MAPTWRLLRPAPPLRAPEDGWVRLRAASGQPQGSLRAAGAKVAHAPCAFRRAGFLYELQYGNTDGWWQSYQTCKKRNRSRKRERAYQFLWSALFDAEP